MATEALAITRAGREALSRSPQVSHAIDPGPQIGDVSRGFSRRLEGDHPGSNPLTKPPAVALV
jgi:hypothetical protein